MLKMYLLGRLYPGRLRQGGVPLVFNIMQTIQVLPRTSELSGNDCDLPTRENHNG